MATLDETYDGMADGTVERPTNTPILRLLVTRSRAAASATSVHDRFKGLAVAKVIGGPEAIDLYKAYCNDPELEVRETVFAYAMEYGNAGLAAIRALLKDSDPTLSHRVFQVLFDQKDRQCTTAVRRLLSDTNPTRRAWAAILLGAMAGPSMEMSLRPLTKDEDDQVKEAAVWAIANLNRQDPGPAPLPSLPGKKKKKAKSRTTAKSAGKAKKAKDDTLGKVVSDDTRQLPAVIEPAETMEEEEEVSTPTATFHTAEEWFRSLGNVQRPQKGLLASGTFTDTQLSEGFRQCRKGGDPAVNRGAAIAAAFTGNTRWVGNLRRLTSDPNPGVRAAVAEALGTLCTNATLVTLGKMLKDDHPSVRAAAARGLVTGAQKVHSEAWACQHLRAASEDKDEVVKETIASAISTLEG